MFLFEFLAVVATMLLFTLVNLGRSALRSRCPRCCVPGVARPLDTVVLRAEPVQAIRVSDGRGSASEARPVLSLVAPDGRRVPMPVRSSPRRSNTRVEHIQRREVRHGSVCRLCGHQWGRVQIEHTRVEPGPEDRIAG
jgi:hypothetical protein